MCVSHCYLSFHFRLNYLEIFGSCCFILSVLIILLELINRLPIRIDVERVSNRIDYGKSSIPSAVKDSFSRKIQLIKTAAGIDVFCNEAGG